MRKWHPGDDVGPLEPWPFDNPSSDYRILRGAPECSGRLEAGGPGHTSRYGIWRCTEGAFSCIEQGDELMQVLDGACVLTDHGTGVAHPLRAGDSLFVRDGSVVTWDVSQTITKVFFGHKADGF